MTIRRIDFSRVTQMADLIPMLQQLADDIVEEQRTQPPMHVRRVEWYEDGNAKRVAVPLERPAVLIVRAYEKGSDTAVGEIGVDWVDLGYDRETGYADLSVTMSGLTTATTYELVIAAVGEV